MNVLVLWKQMNLKQTSETVSVKRRITQIVTQWVPGSRAINSECLTTVRAEIVTRHNQLLMTGGTKIASIGHIRNGNASVDNVLRCSLAKAVMRHWHDFVLKLVNIITNNTNNNDTDYSTAFDDVCWLCRQRMDVVVWGEVLSFRSNAAQRRTDQVCTLYCI